MIRLVDANSLCLPARRTKRTLITALVESMQTRGFIGDPVIIKNGTVQDGKHRVLAARIAGIAVIPTEEIK